MSLPLQARQWLRQGATLVLVLVLVLPRAHQIMPLLRLLAARHMMVMVMLVRSRTTEEEEEAAAAATVRAPYGPSRRSRNTNTKRS